MKKYSVLSIINIVALIIYIAIRIVKDISAMSSTDWLVIYIALSVAFIETKIDHSRKE